MAVCNAPVRGWTLVELVIVIAVAGVLAFTVIPVVRYQSSIRESMAAQQLIEHVRYLQLTAMTSHRRTWIVLDPASESYSAFIESLTIPGRASRVSLPDPLTQSPLTVQFGSWPFNGVEISQVSLNGTTELEFDSRGSPYDATSVALTTGTVVFGGGTRLSISPQTGHIAVAP